MNNKRYYVYSHTRLDRNEIFYIGIGTINKVTRYKRAEAKDRRNKIWNNIVSKTDFRIDIIFEGDDYNIIKNKEIELIKLYGKIKDKTGTLSNISDGGEGFKGYVPTEECRQAASVRMKGTKASQETKDKISIKQRNKKVPAEVGRKISEIKRGKKMTVKINNSSRPILHISKNKPYKSISEAAKDNGYIGHTLGRHIREGKNKEFIYITKEQYDDILRTTGQEKPKIVRNALTDKHKENISKSQLGRIHSEEARRKMSESSRGKIISKEVRDKLSKYNDNNIKIRHILSGEIFCNISQAAIKHSMLVATLCSQLRKGYSKCLFEYVDKPNLRKTIKLIRNKNTGEIFNTIKEAANSVGLKDSALSCQLIRKSKICKFEIYETDIIQLNKTYEVQNKDNNI